MALPKLDPFILVYVAIIANSIFIFGCISVIIYYKCVRPKVEIKNQENEEEMKYNRNPFCFMCWCIKRPQVGRFERSLQKLWYKSIYQNFNPMIS